MPSAAQVLERHAVSPWSSVRVIPSLSSTCLISGMLTQLEAATATQGTNLWSRGEEDLARRVFRPRAVPRAAEVAEK